MQLLPSIVMTLLLVAPVQGAALDLLEGCRYLQNPGNDGDSFHVKHGGKEYIFRLYFVDCPETNDQLEERLREQGKIWKLPPNALMRYGRDAERFTERRLSKPFTVHTRWLDAKGASDLKRYFAFVEYEPGRYLADALVGAGLARVYGASESRPDGMSEREVYAKLGGLQKKARAGKIGAWGGEEGSVDLQDDLGRGHPGEPDRYARQAQYEQEARFREMAETYSSGASGFKPYTVICPGKIDLYSIRTPGKKVGHLKPGTEVVVVDPPSKSLGLVRVQFTTSNGVTNEAQAWAEELGISQPD